MIGREIAMISRNQLVRKLAETFPDFVPDCGNTDLPYIVLGDFAQFFLGIYESGAEDQGKKAIELIECLHVEGDSYIKEAATIGLLESIQNIWGNSGIDFETFVERLLPESRRCWDSVNKFWQSEISYIGADFKTNTEPGDVPHSALLSQ
jgi:hypothetical protein